MKRLLLTLALLLPLAAHASTNLAEAPISRTNLPWWQARFTETLAQAQQDPNAKICLLYTSLT